MPSNYAQEKVINRITAPIQSVLSPQNNEAIFPQVNSALPGFGTFSDTQQGGNAPRSLESHSFAGSLELLPASGRQLETTSPTTLSLPLEQENEPIIVSAQTGWGKQTGNHIVYFLNGNCSFRQGQTTAHSPDAVVWLPVKRNETTNMQDVTFYLESPSPQTPVSVEQQGSAESPAKITDQKWAGHWYSRAPVEVNIVNPLPPQEEPAIFRRGLEALSKANSGAYAPGSYDNTPGSNDAGSHDDSQVTQTQFVSSSSIPKLPEDGSLGFRRIELNPRGDTGIGVSFEPYYPNEPARGGIVVLTGGINLIVEGITNNQFLAGNTVDISADNAVVWSANPSKLNSGGSYTESESLDLEVYLEGNIIYRDGPRVIEASRMYYDAKHKVAYILNGHLSVPITEFATDKVTVNELGANDAEGTLRLKAEILRQMGDGIFSAKNTMVTTSRLGEPTYSLRSRTLTFDRRLVSSSTDTEKKYRQVIVAENNYIAAQKLPIFYWPWIAADVERPTLYLKNFSYGNSGRNGNTVKTLWDPFQILNLRRPDGVDGDVNVTWMSKRGLGHGASFEYDVPSCFHIAGQAKGTFDYWGLSDRGLDQLGGERDSVDYPHSYRYRLHWLHQQEIEMSLPVIGGYWDFRAEVGKVSDRNFVNSFFNSDWHTQENATTAVDLTRRTENRTLGISAEYSLDDCYTNANWLPRLDHFWLGESLFSDYLTWYEHTRIGLVDYQTASTPADLLQDGNYFQHLPWEMDNNGNTVNGTGLVFSTRHELDLPIQAGALKIVPYVLGDVSVWGQDQTGDSAERLYGQGGVRLNLPFWKVNPNIGSRMWYLNGLAHKIDLDAEYQYAQANHGMEDLMLTDPLDLWSVDDFRRRYLVTNTAFGRVMLPQFDPRYYALRSGLASNVTAGNMEIADDLQMFRAGMTHRFQTKRGSVGNRHILDWITFSTHMNFYPQSDQNFGKGTGLFDYNFLWHVGDRFSLFSEGLYDFFDNGQNITRIGGVWNRPDRGSVSLSLDQFSGVVERTYLSMSLGYTMNEKYAMSYITSYDIEDNWQNVGHNFMFERTGESFRLLVGAVYSEALSEWSFSIGLEPVFLRNKRRNY